MSDKFLGTDTDRRYSMAEWQGLIRTNKAEHRAAWEEGRVDMPEHVRNALAQGREEPRPLGFKSIGEGANYLQDLYHRETTTVEERQAEREQAQEDGQPQEGAQADDERIMAQAQEGQQQEESQQRLDHREWTELSTRDPAAAMAAHREGRVDFPEHIARNLEANRNRPLGA